jgi:hypothetical protein
MMMIDDDNDVIVCLQYHKAFNTIIGNAVVQEMGLDTDI